MRHQITAVGQRRSRAPSQPDDPRPARQPGHDEAASQADQQPEANLAREDLQRVLHIEDAAHGVGAERGEERDRHAVVDQALGLGNRRQPVRDTQAAENADDRHWVGRRHDGAERTAQRRSPTVPPAPTRRRQSRRSAHPRHGQHQNRPRGRRAWRSASSRKAASKSSGGRKKRTAPRWASTSAG